MQVKLKNGNLANVQSILINSTYAGIYEGDPKSPLVRQMLLKNIPLAYHKVWGKRPTYLQDSTLSPLPSTTVYVWLDSDSIQPRDVGSELVYIFLLDLDPLLSLQDMIQSAVQNLNWEEHAQDYTF